MGMLCCVEQGVRGLHCTPCLLPGGSVNKAVLEGSAEGLLVSCFHVASYKTAKVETPGIFRHRRQQSCPCPCAPDLADCPEQLSTRGDVHDGTREAMQGIKCCVMWTVLKHHVCVHWWLCHCSTLP